MLPQARVLLQGPVVSLGVSPAAPALGSVVRGCGTRPRGVWCQVGLGRTPPPPAATVTGASLAPASASHLETGGDTFGRCGGDEHRAQMP